MLRIRLTRKGTKKKPFYRIVVTEQRSARDGRFIAMLGYYNPRTEPIQLRLDLAAAGDWIRKGAQPSETVASLLKMAKARQAKESPIGPGVAAGIMADTPSPGAPAAEPAS